MMALSESLSGEWNLLVSAAQFSIINIPKAIYEREERQNYSDAGNDREAEDEIDKTDQYGAVDRVGDNKDR